MHLPLFVGSDGTGVGWTACVKGVADMVDVPQAK